MRAKTRTLTPKQIDNYAGNLRDQERAENTVKQHTNHLLAFSLWLDKRLLTKQELIQWKRQLSEKYAATTVNSMLAAVNGFLRFMGWSDIVVKSLKNTKKLYFVTRKKNWIVRSMSSWS